VDADVEAAEDGDGGGDGEVRELLLELGIEGGAAVAGEAEDVWKDRRGADPDQLAERERAELAEVRGGVGRDGAGAPAVLEPADDGVRQHGQAREAELEAGGGLDHERVPAVTEADLGARGHAQLDAGAGAEGLLQEDELVARALAGEAEAAQEVGPEPGHELG